MSKTVEKKNQETKVITKSVSRKTHKMFDDTSHSVLSKGVFITTPSEQTQHKWSCRPESKGFKGVKSLLHHLLPLRKLTVILSLYSLK